MTSVMRIMYLLHTLFFVKARFFARLNTNGKKRTFQKTLFSLKKFALLASQFTKEKASFLH